MKGDYTLLLFAFALAVGIYIYNMKTSRDTFIESNPAKDIGMIVGVFVGAVIVLSLILYGVRAWVKRYT
jgi:hypothetical protein